MLSPAFFCILKLKANAKHFPFSFSYAERNSGYKIANTEKSVQALFRFGIIIYLQQINILKMYNFMV